MRTNSVMIAFCVFVIGCCLVGTAAATKETRRGGGRKKRMKDMTVFERQSDDGLRHSPLFSLKIEGDNNEQGNEDDGFPSKMVLFNNDLYGEEDDLFKERSDYQIGYSQGHCLETYHTDGFVGECFFTYVLYDEGIVTANGPYIFDVDKGVVESVLAITGGTEKYKGAKGEVYLSVGPTTDFPSLRFDFDF